MVRLRQILGNQKDSETCLSIIGMVDRGRTVTLDFTGISALEMPRIVDMLAPLYIIFEHDSLPRYVQAKHLGANQKKELGIRLERIKQTVLLAEEVGGIADIVMPILRHGLLHVGEAFARRLSLHIPDLNLYAEHFDLNTDESHTYFYRNGEKHVPASSPDRQHRQ